MTRGPACALVAVLVAAGCTAPERAAGPQLARPAAARPAESTPAEAIPKETIPAETLRKPGLVDIDRGGRDRPTIVRADATLSFEIVRGSLSGLTQIGVGRVMLAEAIDGGLTGPLDIGIPASDEVDRLADQGTTTVLDVEPGGRLRLGTESIDVRPDVAKARLTEARGNGEHAAATIRVVPGSTFGDVTHAVRLLRACGFRHVELLGMRGAASVRDWPDSKCPIPAAALRVRMIDAEAVVRVVISSTGRPTDPVIVRDPGYGLGATAASCVMRTAFEPGRDASGKPIDEPVYFRVRFTVR